VVSAEGTPRKVTSVMARWCDDGLIRLGLWGHSHLRLTSEHPVRTKRDYVKAGELRLNDWVALPRYRPAVSGVATIQPTVYIDRARE
jgi:hypothetical protein